MQTLGGKHLHLKGTKVLPKGQVVIIESKKESGHLLKT